MKRGLLPKKGIGPAVQLAESQGGIVMVFEPSKKNIATFVIVRNGMFTIVSLQFTENLWPDVHEIESRFHDAIVALGLVPYVGPVSRELWLYNRYGTIRKFRLGPVGLIGIVERGPAAGPADSGTPGQENSGPGISGTGGPAGTGLEPAATVPPVDPVVAAKAQAVGLNPRSHIVRYLVKKTAAEKPVTGTASRPVGRTKKIPAPGKSPGTSGEPVPAPEDAAEKIPVPAKFPVTSGVPVPVPETSGPGSPGVRVNSKSILPAGRSGSG